MKYKNVKVSLIYPPGDDEVLETDKTSSPFAPPLGLMYIARILSMKDIETSIIDARHERIGPAKIKKLLTQSDVIGISIPSFARKNAEKIIKMIREIDNDIFIIAGGPHCTLFPMDAIAAGADAAVKGEGEYAAMHFKEILEGKDVAGVYRKEGGRDGIIIENLDEIPFPSHEMVKKYEYGYIAGFKPFKAKFTAMISSRGCPYKCKFCSREIFAGRRYRERSVENVLDEIKFVINEGYNGIIFVDDNFLLNRKRVMKVMDGIIEMNAEIKIIVEGARVNVADYELYKKMWDAGVRVVSYGIESGNQDILDFYNKKITLEQVKKAIGIADRVGFFTVGSFIIGAPFEDRTKIEKTIRFATSLPLDFVEFYILEYRVGSELWDEAVKGGLIDKEQYFVKACKENNLGLLNMNELNQLRKKAYIRFYLRPSYVAAEILKLAKYGNADLIKAAISMTHKFV